MQTEIYPENENIVDEDNGGNRIQTQQSAFSNNLMVYAEYQNRHEDNSVTNRNQSKTNSIKSGVTQ